MASEKRKMEKNITEFLERHGQEGFLKLFLTNYLYDLVMYYLHSSGRDREEDTSYHFYFGADDRVYSAEEIDRLREAVRKECSRRASLIVSEMKRRKILDKAIRSPKQMSPELFKLVQDALKGMLRIG